jgi:hypothetical protein
MLTDLQWLESCLQKRFDLDERGRIRTGEPEAVPRFVLARSRHGNTWRFRQDLPPRVIMDLARYAGKENPLGPQVLENLPPERLEPMRQTLLGAGIDSRLERFRVHRRQDDSATTLTPWKDRQAGEAAISRGFEIFADLHQFV